jgi:tetratricopeptide (TPR) repeat protein
VLINFSTREAPILLRRILSTGTWGLAYSDGLSVILARINEANKPLLADAEIKREGFESLAKHLDEQLASVGQGSGTTVSARLIAAGSFFMNMNRLAEAEAVYSLLYAAAPRMPNAGLQLGITERALGHSEKAVELLEEATEKQPKNVLGWLHLSSAYRDSGRESDADAAFQRAGNLNPEAAENFRKQQAEAQKKS